MPRRRAGFDEQAPDHREAFSNLLLDLAERSGGFCGIRVRVEIRIHCHQHIVWPDVHRKHAPDVANGGLRQCEFAGVAPAYFRN